jgi:hypothetical protein
MVKKIIISVIIMLCLNLFVAHDSFAASRTVINSHRGRVYFEICLLVGAIASGIYFFISDSKSSSPQSELDLPKNSDHLSESDILTYSQEKMIFSPEGLVIFRW